MAAAYRGQLYVVGGYLGRGLSRGSAFVLVEAAGARCHGCPSRAPPPEPPSSPGKLYVVGGVAGPGSSPGAPSSSTSGRAAGRASPARSPASTSPQPRSAARCTPWPAAWPGSTRTSPCWSRTRRARAAGSSLPPIPHPRGGTGVAAIGRDLVSIGGEEPGGTIASVYAYDVDRSEWRRLPDIPTPRHGLGVVALNGRVWALAGGERPGLFVSTAAESLSVR